MQTETQEILFKIRNSLFVVRVVKHCRRLPREVIEAPVSEMFKTQLHTSCQPALNKQGFGLDDCQGAFPPQLSCDSEYFPKTGQSFSAKGSKPNKPTALLGCKMLFAMLGFFNEISLLKYSPFKICHNRCYF